MVEDLNRRDFFKIFAGRRVRKETLRPPKVIEGGFFETLYDCDACAKATIARLTQEEQCPTQCPIHGR